MTAKANGTPTVPAALVSLVIAGATTPAEVEITINSVAVPEPREFVAVSATNQAPA